MMRGSSWLWLPVAAISVPAYATSYLTLEQAQQAIFPGAALAKAFVTLTDVQQQEIEKKTGVKVTQPEIKAWRVASGGYFIIDEVVGKHDYITYAIGVNADGSVKQVEIMDYREAYGYEIRNQNWRRQFIGKTATDPIRVDQDIRNISGATLSSRHVAEGVRRVLASHAVALG
jgi:Na+-translocating ferredoxin:NAD+ oxidoreductase RnfG subunit